MGQSIKHTLKILHYNIIDQSSLNNVAKNDLHFGVYRWYEAFLGVILNLVTYPFHNCNILDSSEDVRPLTFRNGLCGRILILQIYHRLKPAYLFPPFAPVANSHSFPFFTSYALSSSNLLFLVLLILFRPARLHGEPDMLSDVLYHQISDTFEINAIVFACRYPGFVTLIPPGHPVVYCCFLDISFQLIVTAF